MSAQSFIDIPKIEPCYRCGLPIPQHLIRKPTQYGTVWACDDISSCEKRIHEQIEIHSPRDKDGHKLCMLSYCSILARDPHYKWTYSFHATVRAGESGNRWSTELTYTGVWDIHAFPSIVKDAQDFAADYDAINLTICNEADDILYEER